jgi:DNA-binding CsgD family transcriptional regulator
MIRDMVQSNFQEMLDKHSGQPQQKIMKICEPFFQTFGVNHFFHQNVNREGLFYVLGTNPDYMHYYVDQKFYDCNPFVHGFGKLNSGIYFVNSVREEEFQSTMRDASEKYNIQHSIYIVENDSYSCNQYAFGIAPGRFDAESLIVNELTLVKEFIKYFNEEMAGHLQNLRANPVVIGPKKEYYKPNVLPEVQLDSSRRLDFLAKLKVPKNLLSHPKLSNREIDCLKLYLMGKSSSEIAEDLELTKRTIEFYIENIKNKLSCYKKSELICLLQQMGKLGFYKELFEDGHIKISH